MSFHVGRVEPHPHATKPKGTVSIHLDRHQVHEVIEGGKTAHVRMVAPGDPKHGPAGAREGERVSIYKKGEGVVCRVKITKLIERALGEMDIVEARLHGYKTTIDYARAFMAAYDHAWSKYSLDELAEKTTDEITARWLTHWAEKRVWVMHFEYDPQEALRYMRAGAVGSTSSPESSDAARGYTSSKAVAAKGEPAAVDDATLSEYAYAARESHQARKEEDVANRLEKRTTAERNIAARLAQTIALAHKLGIDTRSNARLVGRALAAIEADIRAQQQAERAAA